MSAVQSWIERDDAKRAEDLKTRMTSWFVFRVFSGLLFLVKGAHFALTASGIGGYALAGCSPPEAWLGSWKAPRACVRGCSFQKPRESGPLSNP